MRLFGAGRLSVVAKRHHKTNGRRLLRCRSGGGRQYRPTGSEERSCEQIVELSAWGHPFSKIHPSAEAKTGRIALGSLGTRPQHSASVVVSSATMPPHTEQGAGSERPGLNWVAHSRQMGRQTYVPPSSEQICTLTAAELLAGRRPVQAASQQLDLAELTLNTTLWCAGDTALVQRTAVAIVGTRNASADGAARARRLARELAGASVVVVSGLAKGVDAAALTSAIEAGGRVIGVIGTPLDKAYPAENKSLQERMYRDHLLISQFKPGRRVFPSHFPARNRMMALLTDASVIIEASETSGTLHQAAECVRLGRWLFIARSVAENPALTWPSKFLQYPTCRVLTQTSDVTALIGTESLSRSV